MSYETFKDVHVTISDFRDCGYCVKGVRYGFQRYNLDFNAFLVDGIDGETLLTVSNGDSMVLQVVEVANERRRR